MGQGTHKDLTTKHEKLKRHIAYHLSGHRRKDKEGLNDQCARHQQAIATLTKTAEPHGVYGSPGCISVEAKREPYAA